MEEVICKGCGRVIGEDERRHPNQTKIYTFNKYHQKEYAGTKVNGFICEDCFQDQPITYEDVPSSYDSSSNDSYNERPKEEENNFLLQVLLFPFKAAWWVIKLVFGVFWFALRVFLVVVTFGVLKNILFND